MRLWLPARALFWGTFIANRWSFHFMLCSAYRGSFYLGRGSAVPKCLVETGCSFGYLMFTSVACEHLKSIMFIAYLHGDSSVQKFMSCLTRNIFIVMLSLRYGLRGLVSCVTSAYFCAKSAVWANSIHYDVPWL